MSRNVGVFFDTECTHIQENSFKSQLISIGFASLCGKTFYAESADYDRGLCSQFVTDHVLPHLEDGEVRMSLASMAKQIKDFIDSFEQPVRLLSDAPDFDWPFLEQIFKQHGYPQNLKMTNAPSIGSPVLEKNLKEMEKQIQNDSKQVGASMISLKGMRQRAIFDRSLKAQRKATGFRHHHALDDAVANMKAYRDSQQ